jgi:DHA2 family multidrug resistance protein
MSAHLTSPQLPPLPLDRILLLATTLAGSMLVSLSAQFVGANIADVQGGVGATPDEASWISTAYAMASFVGLVASMPLIRTFGLGRYVTWSALAFAGAALACAAAPPLPSLIALRAIQGAAAGGLGPAAFVAVFMVTSGPRLLAGLAVLAVVLLLPGTLGPVLSGFLEDGLGWRGLFLIQAIVGAGLAIAGVFWMPRSPISWPELKTDWVAMVLVSIGLAAFVLVLNQGARRFWFTSDLIVWAAAVGLGAWAGFVFMVWRSPLAVIDPRLLAKRGFIVPISLNLAFRAGLAVTAYLIPQFLVTTQGFRPLQLSWLFLWAAVPQLLVIPVVWWLLHRLDGRVVIGAGLVLCGLGSLLVANTTSDFAADQFRLSLALIGMGQVMFLVPNLQAGAGSLTPADGPTASLAFNATTLGGTTLGVGLATNLVVEREKFHSSILVDHISAYSPAASDRLSALGATFGARVTDEALAAARGAAIIAGEVRREAWVLAFNDAFLVVAVLLLLSALGTLALRRVPPLRRAQAPAPRSAPVSAGVPT